MKLSFISSTSTPIRSIRPLYSPSHRTASPVRQ
jgi:hypothetical protein